MIDYEDVESAKQVLSHWYTLYQEKRLRVETSEVEKYSRRSLTATLAKLLDALQGDA